MKALILSAGFGTRLLPYTSQIPKPLFTLKAIPILEHTIQNLMNIGCEQILINTHHLHEQIDSFIKQKSYDIDIQTIYEPDILDTGGAIANAQPFLDAHTFFVVNSDIISNIDLMKVYDTHKRTKALATLVLHDYEAFNKIRIDEHGYIKNFDSKKNSLAFTGIQVLSPQIYDYFPVKKVFSSIEVYQSLTRKKQVKAYVEKNIFWSDIGTIKSYSMTSLRQLAASQFNVEQDKIKNIKIHKLAGDGSDRKWYRVVLEDQSYIISDHDICMPKSDQRSQLNAFVHIGSHLYSKNIPVPRILNHDALSGMVILDDLGDNHLETYIKQKNNDTFTLKTYKKVIDLLIDFSIKGYQGFNKKWTCQTNTYSKELIIEKECRYFIDAFIHGYLNKGYLNKHASFDRLLNEFEYIADKALKFGFTGLMHRDMQSRNIMIKNYQPYFIDFQSARIGPLQYDLASLLIDPYVNLNDHLKNDLLHYCANALTLSNKEKNNFIENFHYCCLTRNLQCLGAFGFLSKIKKKTGFERYIPNAVKSLKSIILSLNTQKIPKLGTLIQTI
ncbi:MAG: phosphotransferase [Desulfobacteraceae bacterium]|nr:phosphotransferase [Desulfobacteraceae bacterium]